MKWLENATTPWLINDYYNLESREKIVNHCRCKVSASVIHTRKLGESARTFGIHNESSKLTALLFGQGFYFCVCESCSHTESCINSLECVLNDGQGKYLKEGPNTFWANVVALK